MKIGIDARFIGPEGTGLGKYTEKLIENLAKIDSKNHYIIFLRRSNWDWLKLKSKNFTKILADVPWYSIAEQIKLPKIFASQNLDLLHVPHFNVPIFYRSKFIVTIHDLIHHQFTQESATTRNFLIFKLKRFAYRYIIRHTIKNSQRILTPSNFIKNEIIKTFKVAPTHIAVTYEAAEEEYFYKTPNSTRPRPSRDEVGKLQIPNLLKKNNIKTPYIIYVGNAYPHKNLEKLLQAFKILVHSSQFAACLPARQVHSKKSVNREPLTDNLHLMIVCPRDVFWKRLKDKIKEQGLEKQVISTGYIPAQELAVILRSAEAYVSPSLSEGFGIPGLNAMAASVPVVAANIPTLKEVYSNAALYFDPDNPKDIAVKIEQVLGNKTTRSDLVKRGLEQVKKYSWLKMAKETLKVYKQML